MLPASASLYPPWECSRERLEYRARDPVSSVLYRLVYHYRENLEYLWELEFEERYGVLRAEALKSFERYLNCGVLRHGCALACCESCSHSILIPFFCKARGICLSCQAKRAVIFAENPHEEVLLPHPHRHLVFSIPKRLRIYFRYGRTLFSGLYRAAWESWSEYVESAYPVASSAPSNTLRTGMVMSLHTAGTLLNWHPHCHSVALNGVILDDGHFLELPEIDTALIQEYFSEKVIKFLLKRELIDEDVVSNMRSWKHSGFGFYAGEPVPASDTNVRLFLARYLKKAPLAPSRLSIDESGAEPVVRYVRDLDAHFLSTEFSDASKSNEMNEQTFSPLEFLAELSLHIPKVFEQTTRFYGVYSPRTRGVGRREK